MSVQTFKVEGMSCQGCAASIEKVLVKKPQVKSAHVDFAAKQLQVDGELPVTDVLQALDDLGFTAQPTSQR